MAKIHPTTAVTDTHTRALKSTLSNTHTHHSASLIDWTIRHFSDEMHSMFGARVLQNVVCLCFVAGSREGTTGMGIIKLPSLVSFSLKLALGRVEPP